jgi:hypothetical protein
LKCPDGFPCHGWGPPLKTKFAEEPTDNTTVGSIKLLPLFGKMVSRVLKIQKKINIIELPISL